jgi:hypothetical protein
MKLHAIKNNAIVYTVVDEILIIAYSQQQWSDDDYIEFVAGCQRLYAAAPYKTSINFMTNRAPSAGQRRKAVEMEGAKTTQANLAGLAVVTESAVARAATAAFGLLTRVKAKAYKPVDSEQGFDWLASLSRFDRDQARNVYEEVIREAGYNPSIVLQDWRKQKLRSG